MHEQPLCGLLPNVIGYRPRAVLHVHKVLPLSSVAARLLFCLASKHETSAKSENAVGNVHVTHAMLRSCLSVGMARLEHPDTTASHLSRCVSRLHILDGGNTSVRYAMHIPYRCTISVYHIGVYRMGYVQLIEVEVESARNLPLGEKGEARVCCFIARIR